MFRHRLTDSSHLALLEQRHVPEYCALFDLEYPTLKEVMWWPDSLRGG